MSNYSVLLFHSIDDRDLFSLKDLGNIRPELFETLIARLKKEFDIVALDEVVRHISGGKKPKDRLLALTFDDGPKSYAVHAVPVMEAFNVPSSCFLITGCIGDAAIYWRYLYNFCIHKGFGGELAGFISDEYNADIGRDTIISFSRNHYDTEKNRRIMEKLLSYVISEDEYRGQEKDLFLSLEDIERLKKNPLVGFGIHTRTHPVLKCLGNEEIHDEIAGSLEYYRSRIADNVPMFSIPFGRLFKDYDERTIAAARALSIERVLSAYGGGNEEGQPLYNIRRISVHEGRLADGIDHFNRTLHEPSVPDEYSEKEKRLAGLLSGRQ
ncbi:MAG: polysaccharide deacetylase family protein [Nitrospirota bacterium]|nr:polysaccharide deacetylase family protein [Nitrospirota bacterium]